MELNKSTIKDAISKINLDLTPLWGSMDVQDMVEHLADSYKISNGKIKVEVEIEERKKLLFQRFLENEKELPQNVQVPLSTEANKKRNFSNLEEALNSLELEVNDYYKYFEDNPEAVLISPTFGELNFRLWQRFHLKHLIHHLKQFGLEL